MDFIVELKMLIILPYLPGLIFILSVTKRFCSLSIFVRLTQCGGIVFVLKSIIAIRFQFFGVRRLCSKLPGCRKYFILHGKVQGKNRYFNSFFFVRSEIEQ